MKMNIIELTRRKLRMNQKEFARFLGYKEGGDVRVSLMERGRAKIPPYMRLICGYTIIYGKLSDSALNRAFKRLLGRL